MPPQENNIPRLSWINIGSDSVPRPDGAARFFYNKRRGRQSETLRSFKTANGIHSGVRISPEAEQSNTKSSEKKEKERERPGGWYYFVLVLLRTGAVEKGRLAGALTEV